MPEVSLMMFGGFLVLLWLMSALTLRAGCMFTRVPKPGFVGAAMLMLVVGAMTATAHFGLGVLMGMSPGGLKLDATNAARLAAGLGLPAHMIIAATVYKFMLPATFGKAMSVWVLQMSMLLVLIVGAGYAIHTVNPDGWASVCRMMQP